MVLVKNWTFLYLFSLGKIGPEKLFSGILERIIPFLDCKNINIKGRKICIFQKGLVHGFGQKLNIS